MKKQILTIMALLIAAVGHAQETTVEFLTPRIVHVVKGKPTKTLVVTGKHYSSTSVEVKM